MNVPWKCAFVMWNSEFHIYKWTLTACAWASLIVYNILSGHRGKRVPISPCVGLLQLIKKKLHLITSEPMLWGGVTEQYNYNLLATHSARISVVLHSRVLIHGARIVTPAAIFFLTPKRCSQIPPITYVCDFRYMTGTTSLTANTSVTEMTSF